MEKLSGLKGLKLDDIPWNNEDIIENISKRDIAIIGMSVKAADAENIHEYWEIFKNGKDCIKEFPAARKSDADSYLLNQGIDKKKVKYQYRKGAFMKNIDEFDYEFFSISPNEAKLMDPNHRLLLEIVYSAIEDAGYGGKKITGTKTGMYLGWSMEDNFKTIFEEADSSSREFLITGNAKSIMAGRISYLFDLRGPCFLVDTACSSSLVAVHLACQGIRAGECEMAIAGGIRIYFLPLQGCVKPGLGLQLVSGIGSPDQRSKTFDDSADGIGLGEGMGAILLKPLNKALQDRDHIYAVIKGTASNQDGKSISMSAPNSMAQREVIHAAWNDAGIDPETISYIEAHGTGTKLGDPVEIKGLQLAFGKYTNKKQFCAISSAKPNIGHLDVASGITGLIKAVMAITNKQIPPSINFSNANRQINFEAAPVYVNTHLSDWKGSPLRCGVSAYGISGTNCHIVLEEAPDITNNSEDKNIELKNNIIVLSAKNREVLLALVDKYAVFLEKEKFVKTGEICYTANTGRGHYNYRIAILTTGREDLKRKLAVIQAQGLKTCEADRIYYGEHRVVADDKVIKRNGEITETECAVYKKEADKRTDELCLQEQWDNETILSEIGRLYTQGADVNWDALYRHQKRRKIGLPTYPYRQSRCWVQHTRNAENLRPAGGKEIAHPFLDTCLAESMDMFIYSTKFSAVSHWLLKEHRISNYAVIPGVTYLEMAREIFSIHYPGQALDINMMFLSPFVIDEEEEREVQTIVRNKNEYMEIVIAGKSSADGRWIVHAEGKVGAAGTNNGKNYDITHIKDKFNGRNIIRRSELPQGLVHLGRRWDNFTEIFRCEQEYLVYFELPAELSGDITDFGLHPSLMDNAANAVGATVGDGLYLPLSYKKLELYGRMPRNFYGYYRRKGEIKFNPETAVFDITLMDINGKSFAEMEDYTIKKVHETDIRLKELAGKGELFHEIAWVPAPPNNTERCLPAGSVVIFLDENGIGKKLVTGLRDVITVEYGDSFRRLNENSYRVSTGEKDIYNIFTELKDRGITHILHCCSLTNNREIRNLKDLADSQQRGVHSLFFIVKAVLSAKIKGEIKICLISDYANTVTGNEERINPHNAVLFGFGKVIREEYPDINVRCVDIDAQADTGVVLNELFSGDKSYLSAYREGVRYLEQLRTVKSDAESFCPLEWKEQGVYLLTGGMGGIGMEVAKYLTSGNRLNLAMLNRSQFPDRNNWESILSADKDKKLCSKIQTLMDIEKKGSTVSLHSVDISSLDDTRAVINRLRSQYGRINGIIHSAGIAGDGYIINKDMDVLEKVLAPKVQGTWILDRLTDTDNPDFFILFSSLATFIGIGGQSDYTAANSYLDSFSAYRNKLGKKTITINWPGWKETGMAVDYGADKFEFIFKPVTNAEGVHAFAEVLHRKKARVLIGEMDYKSIISLDRDFPVLLSPELEKFIKHKKEKLHTDLQRNTEDTQKISIIGSDQGLQDTEIKLADMWGRLLGLKQIDIYDNFYNLGGDSLIATQLYKEMQKGFPGLVDISDIFTYSTINDMARYIESKIKKPAGAPKSEAISSVNDILGKLKRGEIGVNDAEKLFDMQEDV